MAERVRVDVEPEAGAVASDPAHRRAEADLAATRRHERRRRCREERAEIGLGQQQVARRPVSPERVAQHVREHPGRGTLRWCVQRRDAERDPQPITQGARLAVPGKEPCDAFVRVEREPSAAEAGHEARGREPLRRRQPGGQGQPREQVQRGRQRRRPQPEAGGVAQLERQPHEQPLGIGAYEPHQPQRLAVRTDQDVLAVVEVHAVQRYAARAATEAARRLEDRHRQAAFGQRRRGGQARPAGADDGYAATHVRQAIQSLRIGVSATRWASTCAPSRRISSSSVR